MFNLKAKRDDTRSPSPQIRGPDTPRPSSAKPVVVGSSTATMFDLSKKSDHGYIPGVRPRPQAESISDGGRGRSASRDSRKKSETMDAQRASTSLPDETKRPPTESKTHTTAAVHHAEINVDDIFRAIPASSSKLPLSEIKRLLEGYVALPKSYWSTELVYRQHIRYTRLKDNMFVRGGFITGFGKQRGRATLTLANGFDQKKRGYYVWVIGLDSIGTLFVKRNAEPAIRVGSAPLE